MIGDGEGGDLAGIRDLLRGLGTTIREAVRLRRDERGIDALSLVVGQVTADVTYEVDRVSEHAVLDWFTRSWPDDRPVRVVMEGIEDDVVVTFPRGARAEEVEWICIVDPIDGTRNLMYDKRAAWVLTALARNRPGDGGLPGARLADIELAVMTEIPTAKMAWADQVSAVRGLGPTGVIGERVELRTGLSQPLALVPSGATGFEHGFCSFSHFFPDGKALLVAIEQEVWDALMPASGPPHAVFEDQYLCSGGQIFEVAVGHDRFVGDLRPLVAAHLDSDAALVAHPYDVCTALVLTELGGIYEDPWGGIVDAPLDTTSPVAFMAYANRELADAVRPALVSAITAVLGPAS